MLYTEKLSHVGKNFSDGEGGVFESMRAYDGRPFMLKEHIIRFLESSNTAGIKISLGGERLMKMVRSSLKDKGYKDAYIRLAVAADRGVKVRFNIIVKEAKVYAEELYAKGVSVVTVATKRYAVEAQNPKVKSSSFLNGILAKSEGEGRFESIMLNEKGLITEGSVSNIFIVKDGAIFTTPTYLGALNGITRSVVLKIAKAKGVAAFEIPFTRYELFNADESFLTNTSMEIMPVVNCDGRKIGSARPGPITNMLRREFSRYRRSEKW